MAAHVGAAPTHPPGGIVVLLLMAVLLSGCAAPTPVDLGLVAAAPPTVPPEPTYAPGIATPEPIPTPEPAPVVPVATPEVVAAEPALTPSEPQAPPVEPAPEPAADPPPDVVAEPVPPEVAVPPAPPIERYADDLQGAITDAERVVDGYWATHWGEFFTGTFSPPRVVGLYDGTGPDVPTCAGEPLPPLNAVYCVPEDYVAWDGRLMGLRSQIGDLWPYTVIAHEWGHAIQTRLDGTLNSVALELQADCLAGAALYGAAADGTLELGPDAATEIAGALTRAADTTPWTDVRDHGNAAERVGAFDAGRTGGVRACLPE